MQRINFLQGTTFRTPIQKMMKADTFLHSKLLPFYETARGRTAYNQLLSASEEYLSQYVEEIRGIADGAKVSFIEVNISEYRTHERSTEEIIYDAINDGSN